jgi:hypothetical protein
MFLRSKNIRKHFEHTNNHMEHLALAKLIDTQRTRLVERTVELALQNPFWSDTFGPGFRERLTLDADANLAVLAKGIRYRSPMMLDDHMVWRRNQIVGFGCSTGHAREIWGYKWTALSEQMPQESLPLMYEYIQSAMHALHYARSHSREVAQAHDDMAARLVDATYAVHWHWQAAYGAAGQDEALRDCWFLFDYANDALGTHNLELFHRYLRRQRKLFATRGLSTVHIRQWLWLAAETAEAVLPPAAASELRRVFEAGSGGIQLEGEAYAALMQAQEQIVLEVAEQLTASGMAPQPDYAAVEVGWYLAYLGDSIAADAPDGLLNYTRWMQQWFASQGLPDTPLRQSYSAIGVACNRHLPQYAAQHVQAILTAAQRVL